MTWWAFSHGCLCCTELLWPCGVKASTQVNSRECLLICLFVILFISFLSFLVFSCFFYFILSVPYSLIGNNLTFRKTVPFICITIKTVLFYYFTLFLFYFYYIIYIIFTCFFILLIYIFMHLYDYIDHYGRPKGTMGNTLTFSNTVPFIIIII